MDFILEMKNKAKGNRKTIVLPESYELRTLQATETILKEGLANVILIGDEAKIKAVDASLDISGATCIDPATFSERQMFAESFYDMRKAKGMTMEKATELMLDPMYFGVMLVKQNKADGIVAGAIHKTADVLRPSLQILKTAPGISIVSSMFIMILPDETFGEKGVLVFGDCAINQNPNEEQLASIAKSCADSFRTFTGAEPRVAMLSHSTIGSASHPDVDKVVAATKIAKEKYKDLAIDGELQLDAAIVPSVGKQKAPHSTVAGTANTLVFPDLDAGNIGYKLVQRLAKAKAIGPITQGMAKPVNDLSRGCSAEDIVSVVTITAVQAGFAG